ncbi:LemA protein [Hathewaya proteolytica DSM 3090]|uniref:LemA protein n=1 Tax=Hathewaya proteolytica DSM 3090 TaxID=1121331 RepID=A0A1M6K2U3_9CLOT|nr:LemA family protein [Hathewaya proteolytica]SHJ53250.1 LemA protein [Hathewaya proteolytica DSM 3090]
MKFKPWMIVVVILAVLGIFVVAQYNGLVNHEETVNSKWSQVENNLKRRADLIPNLVSTVKGYASHESNVLKEVTDARTGYEKAKTPEEFAKAEANLKSSINMVMEAYPDLKANASFLSLQDELSGSENRLTVARMDYNNAVENYNKSIRRFPKNIFAGIMGFHEKEYFQITESDADTPEVKF